MYSCVVLGPLPSAEKARWFATEHGQQTTTPRSHVDNTLTERAKKASGNDLFTTGCTSPSLVRVWWGSVMNASWAAPWAVAWNA